MEEIKGLSVIDMSIHLETCFKKLNSALGNVSDNDDTCGKKTWVMSVMDRNLPNWEIVEGMMALAFSAKEANMFKIMEMCKSIFYS